MEIGGRSDDERSILRSIWEATYKEAILEAGNDKSKTRDIRDKTHALRRHRRLQTRQTLLIAFSKFLFIDNKTYPRFFRRG
jgi:hypothetical protein